MSANPDRPDSEETESASNNVDNGATEATTDEESTTGTDTPADALEALQAKAEEHWDRYVRAAAEVENVRKRAVRDVEKARKYALEGFGRDLLAEEVERSHKWDVLNLKDGSELWGSINREDDTEIAIILKGEKHPEVQILSPSGTVCNVSV